MKKQIIMILLSAAACSLQAATLIGEYDGQVSSVDLTATGETDWAYWSGAATDGVPDNRKSGGNGMIGDVSAVGGTGLRTSSSDAPAAFSFTDGSSTASGSDLKFPSLFNDTLSLGNGVSVEITLPTTDIYSVTFVGAAYITTGTMTATLYGDYGGASETPLATYTNDSGLSSSWKLLTGSYTFTVQADNAGDVLKLVFITNTAGNASSNVRVQAVTAKATVTRKISLEFIISN